MRRLLWMLLLTVAAETAYGTDKGADGRKEEDDEGGTVRLEVPAALRGKGYRLRYDGNSVDLDASAVSIHDSGAYYGFQLVDGDGRVLDGDDGYLQEDSIAGMRPNHYRVGLHVGSAVVASEALEDVFQDGQLSEQSLDFTWLPGPLGLAVSFVGLGSLEEIDPGLKSDFDELQWRVGAVYELVPFRHAAGYASWVHLDLTLAAMHVRSFVNIGDGVIDISDKSTSGGVYLGGDLLFPIFDFWLSVRGYVSRSQVEFEKLSHKSEALRRGLLLGGFYAF